MVDAKDQEFLKRLQATFRIEAEEHLRALSAGLMELGEASESSRRAEMVETLFREAHSLKGAARSVNLKDIESLCQPMESTFAALQRQEITLSPALFDSFHQATDAIAQLVSSSGTERTPADRSRTRELIRQLDAVSRGEGAPVAAALPAKAPPPARSIVPAPVAPVAPTAIEVQAAPRMPTVDRYIGIDTVRIPTSKLDPLLLQAEEMIQAKIAGSQRVADLREINQAALAWKTEWDKWQDQPTLQGHEFQEWNAARLDALVGKVAAVTHALEEDQRALRRMVDDHLEGMKQVLMLPVSTLVELFPRLVRDLARDEGKEVDLVIRGAEIVIDKRILEELKDPLIHLVRNCVDHGIEKPDERARKQKPRRGTITLTFSATDSRQVEILVSDDGEGIDVDQVKSAATKMGILSAEAVERQNPEETVPLIFHSGISTSPIITNISGRGLGLAIVREKAEKLGGVVSVDTQRDVGTTFRLLLPLTLTTFRGILVYVGEQGFVLPTSNVERVLKVSRADIKTVETRETLQVDGRILSLVGLGNVLGLPARRDGPVRRDDLSRQSAVDYIRVVVLAFADKRIAVYVDEVFAEEEVLLKGLSRQLSRVRNIAGVTVLGTGKVVPILNVADLLKSALRPGAEVKAPPVVDKTVARVGRILVAEDSITARTLLKYILETAGYRVTTAFDGADAFTQLHSGEFDLMVSDVDMPRMSGFELTTKVRGDKKLGELPVVLMTSLESREDRERGIEVGANAYIVKSSFDQNNLLEVIRGLL